MDSAATLAAGTRRAPKPDPRWGRARGARRDRRRAMPVAEGVGFEPTVTCATMVFETIRFGRSRIPPRTILGGGPPTAPGRDPRVELTANGACRAEEPGRGG